MPVFDFECPECGCVTEQITPSDQQAVRCPNCQAEARKIISVRGPNCANPDAEWIRSVVEVVDKEGDRFCREFVQRPTRENYRRWMQSQGLRHLEPGEERHRPQEMDMGRVADKLAAMRMARNRIEVRGCR